VFLAPLLIVAVVTTTTAPSSQPTIFPRPDAPTVTERIGHIDTLNLRRERQGTHGTVRWDVAIKDRKLLARIESMRLSDWRGPVLYIRSDSGTARTDESEFAATIGVLKLDGRPIGLTLKAKTQPAMLFVEADPDADRELATLLEAEIKRQQRSSK